jgi:hypothetical protein
VSVERVEERLHEEATACVGATDFGATDYRAGLRVFLEALASDGGRDDDAVLDAARVPALRALVGRLYSEQGWRAHPQYADVPIVAPIFIVGLPRSGTTALHQLLATDSRFQGIENWLVEAPMVRPPRAEWDRYPTYREAAERAEALSPQFRTVHWVAPGELDECIRIHVQCCVSNHFGSQRTVPSYDEWFLRQDQAAGIRRLADNYRLIGATTDPARTWLLKNPSHLFNLDEILDEFPDARIVLTHRDPRKTVPSVCSLLHAMRHTDREPADPVAIGRRELTMWGTGIDRMTAARRRRPEAFLDVLHTELIADPLGLAHRVYDWLDIAMSPQVAAAMRGWVQDVAPSRRGDHRYDATTYGLSDGQITERFADYMSEFELAAAR